MYLEKINSPKDLKQLNIKQLEILCQEIRDKIISVAENNGGHLASSLCAVDAIVALYYVFDFPKDKLIFDVGHQAYAHKILSERREQFDSIRKEGGLSSFPDIFESVYDGFTAGHAGNSISAGLGYAMARDKLGDDYNVIVFVGDGSFVNGENLEALFSSIDKPKKFLIVLNDNGMSISKNDNGLYKLLTKMSMKKHYSTFMHFLDKVFGWNFIGKFLKRLKASFKRSLDPFGMMDNLGLKYVGAFDGHNIKLLVKLFTYYKESPRATLLHIKTKKGKGYEPAENDQEYYHGVSKGLISTNSTFSNSVGKILSNMIENDNKIVAITAGMLTGTGLSAVKEKYPDNVYDVGISEEYAVTYAAGLSLAGLKPIVCIYSTFLQRGYDQLLEDICLQKQKVIFLLDRAGLVGADGKTHQGIYDLSYLSHLPNITILAPKDTDELEMMLKSKYSGPVAIRYPNGDNPSFNCQDNKDVFNWQELSKGDKTVIFAVGPRMNRLGLELSQNDDSVALVNARCVKPLDTVTLLKYKDYNIITLEENVLRGGFGSSVMEYYSKENIMPKIKCFGVDDNYVNSASVDRQLELSGLTVENIKKYL